MKIFLNLCCAASILGLLTIAASDLGLPVPVGIVQTTARGFERKPSFEGPAVFNPHARSKVVQYFDTYRGDPSGLPAACAAEMKIDGMPAGWRNPEIGPRRVIDEAERSYLVDTPAELVRVLPSRPSADVRYYLAGSYLVALDAGYRIRDSILISTVRLGNDREPVERHETLQLVGNVKRGGR